MVFYTTRFLPFQLIRYRSLRARWVVQILWFILFLLCAPGISAQSITSSDSISFDEAQSLFLRNNPALASARSMARRQALEARIPSLWPNPSLEGDIETASSQQSLVLDQPIPNPIFFRAQKSVSGARAQAAQAMLQETASELYLELRRRYLSAMASEARLRNLEAVIQPVRRAIEVALARLEEGDIGQHDINRLRVALAAYEDALARAQSEHEISLAALSAFVSADTSSTRFINSDSLRYVPVFLEEAELAEQVLWRRASFIAALSEVEAARASLRGARAARWPGVSIRTGIGRETASGDTSIGPLIGLGLELPIWSQNKTQVGASEAALDEATSSLEVARRAVLLETEAAFTRLQSYRSRLERRAALAGTDSLLADALALYQEGETGLLELLDAVSAARDANAMRIDLIEGYLESFYELERAIGLLPEAFMSSLDPR